MPWNQTARLDGGPQTLDVVSHPEHNRAVACAFLSAGISGGVRRGWTFHDGQDSSSASEKLQQLRPHLSLASLVTTTAETIQTYGALEACGSQDPGLHRTLSHAVSLKEFLLAAYVPVNSCTGPRGHGRMTHQPQDPRTEALAQTCRAVLHHRRFIEV